MALIVDAWEVARAIEVTRRIAESALSGIIGAETIVGPLVDVQTRAQYEAADPSPEPPIRAMVHALFPALRVQPPWWTVDPGTSGTIDDMPGVPALPLPGFLNAWANYDTAVAWPAAARLNAFGELEMRGLVKNATTGALTTIFRLPPPLRPRKTSIFCCAALGGAAQVLIDVHGNVTLNDYVGGGVATWVDLGAVRIPL